MSRRMAVLLSILGGYLLLMAAWGYRTFQARRVEAAAARLDLTDCRRMAGRIRRLLPRPAMTGRIERRTVETTRMIAQAARAAGVPSESLSRIVPGPARRIDDTVYKEKPTSVLLRKVTLKQVVALTHWLGMAGPGLRARSIRLTAPRRDASGKLWTAEIVFVHVVHAPPETDPRTPAL